MQFKMVLKQLHILGKKCSFDGSPRDMAGKYQDAMAICKEFGKPTFFITFTANPQWQEVTDSLLPGQNASDRPRISSKAANVNEFIEEGIFGRISCFL